MAHFAVVKLSYIMEDTSFGLLSTFPVKLTAMYLYKRSKMAIIISDERDLGSGIVLYYRSLQKSTLSQNQSVAQSNSHNLN